MVIKPQVTLYNNIYIQAQSNIAELKVLVNDGVDIGELPVIGIYRITSEYRLEEIGAESI